MSGPLALSYALLWALVVGESVLLLLMFRELGRIYLSQSSSFARDGVDVGSRVPDIGVRLGGRELALADALPGASFTVIVAARDDCPYCLDAARAVAEGISGADDVQAIVLMRGRVAPAYHQLAGVAVAEVGERAFARLRIRATPFGLVVSETGRVLSKGILNHSAHLTDLLEQADRHAGGRVMSARFSRDVSANGGSLNVVAVTGSVRQPVSTRENPNAT
jgi:hypothetical protein